jgi:hypothetical protein
MDDRTKAIHDWMKSLPDDQKQRLAINWCIPHSIFNVCAAIDPSRVDTDFQRIDWFSIHKTRDLGSWSHGGKVNVICMKGY